MTVTAPQPRLSRIRVWAAALAVTGAALVAPVVLAEPAHAVGDVCDLCSINFDPGACDAIGGWPYDSTLEDPPPAVSGGGSAPAQPAPAQPAPAQPAPAQPAPAQPQPQQPGTTGSTGATQSGTGTSTSTSGSQTGTAPAPAEGSVAATVPAAPGALAYSVAGRKVSLTWTAPADGGAALTGYKVVFNDGTPLEIAADATSYEITLGPGQYEAVLYATNAVGDSEPTAAVAGIVVGASPSPSASPSLLAAAAASDSSDAAPLAGGIALGMLVVAAGGGTLWWWLRRRAAHTAAE